MIFSQQPFIKAEEKWPEITLKVIVLSILLALILAAANAYLALKIGILTSASIPAAILSMEILRCFKQSNILENNLVQTAASAGEAIAGGVVYTLPALLIIGYWTHFNYWQTMIIALLGGLLGVLFSIPLRRILVSDQQLGFPEGKAIAEVLILGTQKVVGLKEILLGGSLGAFFELLQSGFKLVSNDIQVWLLEGQRLFGFGMGFSATLIGAGYLIGFELGLSLLVGAILGWCLLIPIISGIYPIVSSDTHQAVVLLWNQHIRYIGIGAMLTAGILTLLSLAKPFWHSLCISFRALSMQKHYVLGSTGKLRTDQDLANQWVIGGILLVAILLAIMFNQNFAVSSIGLSHVWQWPFVMGSVSYVLIIGFLFAAICGYFSGLVGVTVSPGSAIIIAGLLIAAALLNIILRVHGNAPSSNQLLYAEAITILLGAVITGAACIANDNIQDLKVGYLVGATPWKQQIMLILGAFVAASIIPLVMELLFNAYGIAGVFPRPNMDPNEMLTAPPAAMMAGMTQAVFTHQLPWGMVGIGVLIALSTAIAKRFACKKGFNLSILGIAMGIYFPLSTTTPLFIGALIARLINRRLGRDFNTENERKQGEHKGILFACGLVAGAALMNVILAVPMAFYHNPNILNIMPVSWGGLAELLGIVSTLMLAIVFYRLALRGKVT